MLKIYRKQLIVRFKLPTKENVLRTRASKGQASPFTVENMQFLGGIHATQTRVQPSVTTTSIQHGLNHSISALTELPSLPFMQTCIHGRV